MLTKEDLRKLCREAGAAAVGFAKAERVSPEEEELFRRWLGEKKNAGMGYMHNYPDLRGDPSVLLPGAQTVVSLAFPYRQPRLRKPSLPMISRFAYGEDYHKVLRRRLRPVCRLLDAENSCSSRICTDSAPVRERYWALKCGIGFLGKNGQLITPEAGSYVLLAEIITTFAFEPDTPAGRRSCAGCGGCMAACPGKAIGEGGSIDASRCLAYLTIEHSGEWPGESLSLKGRALFGCDRCQEVCPHNNIPDSSIPTTLPEFLPSDHILSLDSYALETMTSEEFDTLFGSSPLRRAGLQKLLRNLK